MKTKYLWIVLIALFTQTGYAQKEIDRLFRDFSKEKNVNRLSVGDISMKLAGLFTDVMGVEGIEILSLDECSSSVKENFQSALKTFKGSGYETMVTSNENNSRTRVLVKIEEEIIRELLVFTSGDNNALVRIKGKITPSDIDTLIKKHKNE